MLSRLASFASGSELVVTGKESPVEALPRHGQREFPIAEIVAHAASLRIADGPLAAGTVERVLAYSALFSAAARRTQGLNIFAYHADLPSGAGINYVDAKLSPHEFDYQYILARFIERIRQWCPKSTVYLATGANSRYRTLAADDVAIVELPVQIAHPMYERANALLAYARSAAFNRDTVFLDSDAFVNRPLAEVFSLGFDIGLTYREGPRLMPVNEGVMFLSARRPEAVASFLVERLKVYDRLLDDALIGGYYGDVRRWRGGQLSLNALTHSLFPCSPYRSWRLAGADIRFLPCDTYNFAAGEGEADTSLVRLEDRYVVHFKGTRKYALVFAARAEGRPRSDH